MNQTIKILHQDTYFLNVLIKHPLSEFGEFTMHVLKCSEFGNYIFSIPSQDWVYKKNIGIEINIKYAPTVYNYPPYKTQLIATMNYLIKIF